MRSICLSLMLYTLDLYGIFSCHRVGLRYTQRYAECLLCFRSGQCFCTKVHLKFCLLNYHCADIRLFSTLWSNMCNVLADNVNTKADH